MAATLTRNSEKRTHLAWFLLAMSERAENDDGWIEDIRKDKPYQLDDKIEQLFHEKSVTGRAAWNRLFDETIASLRFQVRGEELAIEPTSDDDTEPAVWPGRATRSGTRSAGSNAGRTYSISGANSGSVSGGLTFSNVEYLEGGLGERGAGAQANRPGQARLVGRLDALARVHDADLDGRLAPALDAVARVGGGGARHRSIHDAREEAGLPGMARAGPPP